MDTNHNYQIMNGPSAGKLLDAFKYAYDNAVQVEIKFTICAGYTMHPSDPRAGYIGMDVKNIIITAIQHEDGSGRSFNLYGYCEAKEAWAHEYGTYRFSAYYDTRTRKGTIRFKHT